jgi:hypothetical protein
MLTVLGRLFLFLLLVCEWAGDPHFGNCPFSRPMSSQPVYCHSLPSRHRCRLRMSILPSRMDLPAAVAAIDGPPASASPDFARRPFLAPLHNSFPRSAPTSLRC